MYLLNSKSYYLSSNDDEKLWSFMYDEKSEINFKTEFSKEWENFVEGEKFMYTQNGIFVASKVALEEKFKANENMVSNNAIILDERSRIVVSHISQEVFVGNAIALNRPDFLRGILKKYLFSFIFIFFLSLFIAFIRNITRRAKARIKFHSEYDAITKVLNRRAGLERLELIISSNSRRRTRTCIGFMDINGLKEVNDKLGHDKGDELIILFQMQ